MTNNEAETDGFKEANVALFRAHNYVKQSSGSAAKALSFITDVNFINLPKLKNQKIKILCLKKVYAKSGKNTDLTADLIVKEFKKRYPKEKNMDDVFGFDSDYDEGRKVTIFVNLTKIFKFN